MTAPDKANANRRFDDFLTAILLDTGAVTDADSYALVHARFPAECAALARPLKGRTHAAWKNLVDWTKARWTASGLTVRVGAYYVHLPDSGQWRGEPVVARADAARALTRLAAALGTVPR